MQCSCIKSIYDFYQSLRLVFIIPVILLESTINGLIDI
jgi:hypothetical protein